jgi:hypothetical protein
MVAMIKISRWFVLCHLFSMHCAIAQVCDDASIDGADADDSLLPFETLLPIANPGSNLNQQTFFTVQFRGVNEKDFGDYTDGFSPSNTSPIEGTPVPGCAVLDDFTHAFGDPNEARLAAALTYRETGACPSSASSAARQLRVGVDPAAADGVIIAHPLTRIRLPLPDELTGNLPDLQ